MAYWPRDRVQLFILHPTLQRTSGQEQPWPKGHAIAFNPITFNPITLAYWPRFANNPQPWPKGHAIAFNPITLAKRPRFANNLQPSTFNLPPLTFNLQPSTFLPSSFNRYFFLR
ncbi:hypothetical protein BJP36_38500 [Moorena producens JHB]|uniref:Uncharacterized protein n=1 Tax=Moorena producens (strain JHB) TaxID=1454205 RepID=A0A9Q9SUL0_MOOP1|nr:hypothetical protein [Moorena producens]WAN69971.1 hypothetical protein BJP36_38500 [Moorena producens JHB]